MTGMWLSCATAWARRALREATPPGGSTACLGVPPAAAWPTGCPATGLDLLAVRVALQCV